MAKRSLSPWMIPSIREASRLPPRRRTHAPSEKLTTRAISPRRLQQVVISSRSYPCLRSRRTHTRESVAAPDSPVSLHRSLMERMTTLEIVFVKHRFANGVGRTSEPRRIIAITHTDCHDHALPDISTSPAFLTAAEFFPDCKVTVSHDVTHYSDPHQKCR